MSVSGSGRFAKRKQVLVTGVAACANLENTILQSEKEPMTMAKEMNKPMYTKVQQTQMHRN